MPPIFVVGSGRSGTTILDRALGEHRDLVSFPFEPQVFARSDASHGLFEYIRGTAEDPSDYLWGRYRFKSRQKEYGFCQWIPEDQYRVLVDRLVDGSLNPPEAICRFFDSLYTPYLEAHGAKTWIDSSPVNGRFIPEILSVFPNAIFIHIIRDGRNVAKSLARLGWKGGTFESGADFWFEQVTETRSLGSGAPDSYIELSFDDLVSRPADVLSELTSFIGVPYEPRMGQVIDPDRARTHEQPHSSAETAYVRNLGREIMDEFGWSE